MGEMIKMGASGNHMRGRLDAALGGAAPQGAAGAKASEWRPRAPMGASFTVHRTGLVREIAKGLGAAGIAVICAPTGFGKTGLILQYAEEVTSDPGRGIARIVDAAGHSCDEVIERLESLKEALPTRARPLIAIDDVPSWGGDGPMRFAECLRSLRAEGFEVMLGCKPANEGIIRCLGDSAKFGAQTLKIKPREYAEWSRVFSISNALDVYELTQGIPALVASLSSVVSSRDDDAPSVLDETIESLYREALRDLKGCSPRLHRGACLMLLMGEGGLADLERCGLRLDASLVSRLVHDYPIFGIDVSRQTFRCLMTGDAPLKEVRTAIASESPQLVAKAARTLIRVGSVDAAQRLASSYLDPVSTRSLIAQHPLAFTLAGFGMFVAESLGSEQGLEVGNLKDSGEALALYAAGLTLGNIKLARAAAAEVRRRATSVPRDVSAGDWELARALGEVWGSCQGIELPEVKMGRVSGSVAGEADGIRSYLAGVESVVCGPGAGGGRSDGRPAEPVADRRVRVRVPALYRLCGEMLAEIARGTTTVLDERDALLLELEEVLRSRRLSPLAILVRLVVSARRLLNGLPVTDERAFQDAETLAVRTSQLHFQLLCMMMEGWHFLEIGQLMNAQFRAQQISKIAPEEAGLAREWAQILERCAHIRNTSRVTLHEEADMIDLAGEGISPGGAWAVSLSLSAARFDGELAAWFSLHKDLLGDVRVLLPARLAVRSLGSRADSVRRLMPEDMLALFSLDGSEPEPAGMGFEAVDGKLRTEPGQIEIKLFGGFRIARNGHVLTDELWHRRKTSVLAARLALAMGAFVSRRVLTEELWPQSEFKRARDSLYTTLSALRRALGQRKQGPTYLIVQGDGIALNTEYITSDVLQFEMLAREVLLKRASVSAPQAIESCLKIEQLYAGPLYVPDKGSPAYFVHMRDLYRSKFVDCMLKGIEVAIEEGDMSSASWMVHAALREMPGREDVIRMAMRVYDLTGRRREVVDLYNGHLHLLAQETNQLPEPETRQLYDDIISRSRTRNVV